MPTISRPSVWVGLLLFAASCSPLQCGKEPRRRIFVSNYKSDTVSVIEGSPEREVKAIAVGSGPGCLALRLGPKPLLAVTDSASDEVGVVDPVKAELVRKFPVGITPDGIVFSPDGNKVYVSHPKQRTIAVYDVEKGAAVGAPISFDGKPTRMVVSPDQKRVYAVLKEKDGQVVALDANTLAEQGRAPVGQFPTDLGLNADGSRLVAASFDDNKITVIDTSDMHVVSTIKAETGMGLVVHPSKPIVYSMSSFDDEVYTVDLNTGAVLAHEEYGEWPTYSTITKDGRLLYIVHEESDNVVVVDTATAKVVNKISIGSEPSNAVIFHMP